MKNKFAALALAATVLMQVGVSAFADDAASTEGPMTSSGNAVWQVVSFPLRLVTGGTGIVLGAAHNGVKGIVDTEGVFARNTYGRADENPLWVPVGLLGTVAAIPYGFVTHVPEGAVAGADYGYHVWDNF